MEKEVDSQNASCHLLFYKSETLLYMFVHNHLSLVSRNVFSDVFHLLFCVSIKLRRIAHRFHSPIQSTNIRTSTKRVSSTSVFHYRVIDSVCLNCASLCPKAQLRSKYLACCGYGVVYRRREFSRTLPVAAALQQ